MMEWKPTPHLRFVLRSGERAWSKGVTFARILQQKWAGYDGMQGSTVQYEWRDVATEEESDD